MPQFSDSSPNSATRPVPAARSVARRSRPPRDGRIAGHVVPHSLRPVELRNELTELGNLFRAYQQRTEPDLILLGSLQTRKAAAFTAWAEVTGNSYLLREAKRAGQAADTAHLQHQQRSGRKVDCEPTVIRVVPRSGMWDHARSVLAHCADQAPLPGPEARLVMVMLTLRTAHTGTGNLVGQDLTGLGLTDPEQLMEQLTGCGWLSLPGSVADLLDSRPENPTPITIPSLLPDRSKTDAFVFGRHTRAKLSGWAQKAVADRNLRTTEATASARLLALVLATQTSIDGHLGTYGQGVALTRVANWCAADPAELADLLGQLISADWLADSTLTTTRLTGQLTDRVLPLTCPLPAMVQKAP
ncbi:hypothetical protein ACIQVR_37985 [Streptomyces xanthochromogenes]|uniref:hypothetical protein n=1 Tax=Streptomyces xanthochromogenes TaxID=67384 RepID=UPI00381E07EE